MSCPTHRILNQTFSVEKMRYFIKFSESLGLCDNCYNFFVHKLEQSGPKEDIRSKKLFPRDAPQSKRRKGTV